MKKRFFGAAILAAFFFVPERAEASQSALRRAITAGARAHCRTILNGGSWTDGMRATQRTAVRRWYGPADEEHRTMLARLIHRRINQMCPEAEARAYRRFKREETAQRVTPVRRTYGQATNNTSRGGRDRWVTR